MINSLGALLRIRQWAKNGFVLAPLFFGSGMANTTTLARAASAFVVFCLVSSAVYIFNDWRDIEADRRHAKKAMRPLASGRVPIAVALALMAALLAAAAAMIVLTSLPGSFIIAVAVYLAINIGYSLGIKHVSMIELFFVASGLLVRLIAGGYAVQAKLSPWIIIATGILALLMSVGKRRGDIAQNNDPARKRKSLDGYNLGFLDVALAALTGGIRDCIFLEHVDCRSCTRFGFPRFYAAPFE